MSVTEGTIKMEVTMRDLSTPGADTIIFQILTTVKKRDKLYKAHGKKVRK